MKPVARETLDLLMQASTATIQTQLFKRGLRNTFMFGLSAMNPKANSFAAEAFTLRYIPAREDIDVVGAFEDVDHPQRLAIESVPAGHVLVMDCRQESRAASGGQILMSRLLARGVAGMVTDASVRDSPAIAQMDLPVFAAGASATLNLVLHHAVDLQVPIGCAGVPVYPGDVLVGDAEGVVVVPRYLAAEVAFDAAEQERLERFLLARIQAGFPLSGSYPPDGDTLSLYRTSQTEITAPIN